MDYRQLEGAVIDAYRGRDYALCFSLVDRFLETAVTTDRARALSLKASLIYQAEPRRAPEGLVLVEEVLPQVAEHPGTTLLTLVTALALCHAAGDVERAGRYETLSHRLLHDHSDHAQVRRSRFRLHLNLGLMASWRGEHVTAYWHFLQGTNSLLAIGADDGSDGRAWLFSLYLGTVRTCFAMGRLPEAEESLQQAEQYAVTPLDNVQCRVERARLLLHRGRPQEATATLTEIDHPAQEALDADTRTRSLIVQALLAKHANDHRGFRRYLAGARKEATANALHFLLSDIQRIQRGWSAHENGG